VSVWVRPARRPADARLQRHPTWGSSEHPVASSITASERHSGNARTRTHRGSACAIVGPPASAGCAGSVGHRRRRGKGQRKSGRHVTGSPQPPGAWPARCSRASLEREIASPSPVPPVVRARAQIGARPETGEDHRRSTPGLRPDPVVNARSSAAASLRRRHPHLDLVAQPMLRAAGCVGRSRLGSAQVAHDMGLDMPSNTPSATHGRSEATTRPSTPRWTREALGRADQLRSGHVDQTSHVLEVEAAAAHGVEPAGSLRVGQQGSRTGRPRPAAARRPAPCDRYAKLFRALVREAGTFAGPCATVVSGVRSSWRRRTPNLSAGSARHQSSASCRIWRWSASAIWLTTCPAGRCRPGRRRACASRAADAIRSATRGQPDRTHHLSRATSQLRPASSIRAGRRP
jgi:hypothetical protein